MENFNNNIESVENVSNTNQGNPQKPKELTSLQIAAIVFLIAFIICIFIILGSNDNSSNKKNGASTYYIESCTEEFILRFYSLKFPDTFKLDTIDYKKTSYTEDGYELWATTGYFTAENALGLRVKTTYTIFMQYKFSDDTCHALWVIIDDETYYGSSANVKALDYNNP